MTTKQLIEGDRFDELIAAIEAGADVNAGDRQSTTGLMRAAFCDRIDAVARFLALGADVNRNDRKGWTALHFAAQQGSLEAAKRLLAQGATVDALDIDGNTPLWRAAMSCSSELSGAMASLLVQAGADPQRQNLHGVSPAEISPELFAPAPSNP